MTEEDAIIEWQPARFTPGAYLRPKPTAEIPYQVLILNQPIKNTSLLLNVCERAFVRACADGGANRVRELGLTEGQWDKYHIDLIIGDFDSCRPEVEAYYHSLGAILVKNSDQYSTDFMKSTDILRKENGAHTDRFHRPQNLPLDIAIFGSLGGRVDQAFSQLNHLSAMAKHKNAMIPGKPYLITPESIIFLLEVGVNRIHAPVGDLFFTQNVGIIPIGKPAVITTRGLEWDVSAWPTEFGGQMSTSNHIMKSIVEVETSEPVLFTLEFSQQPPES